MQNYAKKSNCQNSKTRISVIQPPTDLKSIAQTTNKHQNPNQSYQNPNQSYAKKPQTQNKWRIRLRFGEELTDLSYKKEKRK